MLLRITFISYYQQSYLIAETINILATENSRKLETAFNGDCINRKKKCLNIFNIALFLFGMLLHIQILSLILALPLIETISMSV